jgi:hypothetical protein
MKSELKVGTIVSFRGSQQTGVVTHITKDEKTGNDLYEVFWVANGIPNAVKIDAAALDAVKSEVFDADQHPAVIQKLHDLGEQIRAVRAVGADIEALQKEIAEHKGEKERAVTIARTAMPELASGVDVETAMSHIVRLGQTWKREGNEQIEKLKGFIHGSSGR